ncbi:protein TRIGALACTOSYLDIACYLGLYCEROL 4, chloroplastic [Phalaenopsis equestris]|uniref:protein TRIGALACTOSYLDIACYLGLYCEROL 4, chloroplastic n=1 Tax=Phalaenopsis equestris TaxID=78828 RepID=UPI0009E23946|nr:protein TRIGALACTOSYLDIACYLGLYCEROL 4, chloroplastic [Phalaenopsis equestris]
MASLRLAMDAAFWDLNVASSQTLDGAARFVAGEPAPLSTARASRTVRPQQFSFLRHVFPLGIIPCFSPTPHKELGSFSLQSLLLAPEFSKMWFGLVGQFRPRKLISSIKKDLSSTEYSDLSIFKEIGKHFVDKSLYALGFFSQFSLSDDTSLLFNVEKHGERKAPRSKVVLFHKLPKHDVTLEAAWPELYVARNGTYWEVPSSASFDVSSLKSESGFRYRFGLHKNDGNPAAFNFSGGDIPLSLMPGICAKAAFSIEKRRNIWRESGYIVSQERKSEKRSARLISYDKQLEDPHAALSAIIGGTCEAWFGGNVNKATNSEDRTTDEEIHKSSSPSRSRHHFNMDLFGSFGCSFQRGRFANDFNDLTRLDARLDVSSASALLKGFSHLVSTTFKGKVQGEVNPLTFPRLNVLFQQQVAGPIVFRADVGFSNNSPSGSHFPHVEDVIYGLSYSLRMLHSGKFLAWYSTKRKEGMVELRFFEF